MKNETKKSFALANTRADKSKLTNLRRWFLLITVLALAAAGLRHASDIVNAQGNNLENRFAKAPITGKVIPKVPLGREVQGRRQRESTVVLKMSGDPVARVRARAFDKRIPESQRIAIVQNLRARQNELAAVVEERGGKVMAQFQHAINGIKVRGTAEQIAEFAKLPGVVEVKPVGIYKRQNAASVPFIGAPAAWQGPPNLRGENIRIAIIDSGIDYTHANFGGPGTVASYNAAFATSTQPADPSMFGANAPKVKGGIDLVGDNYDLHSDDPADWIPHPDPNPLDCNANGHGTHVAGTAAGFGVTSAGATFTGPYDASTPGMAFRIGPGVAPRADLYAVRVHGCGDGTEVVIEALDWAVQNDMQVVNMSLGTVFSAFPADLEASNNAVDAGIVVVAVAGNNGPAPYITHSPGAADKVISVAAMDTATSVPSVSLELNTGGSVTAQNSTEASISYGTVLPVVVLRDSNGDISLGCDESEYVDSQIAGKLVVTRRGVCGRVLRLFYATDHGAAAVAMINDTDGYPPLEGRYAEPYTIPFLGVRAADTAALTGAASITFSDTVTVPIPNPGFRTLASFTSAGPRSGDGRLKPDVTAPGVRVVSSAVGSGTFGLPFNGTSMATPHVAGVAALAIQAHPTWTADQIAAAIVNTGAPSQITNYAPRRAGSGLVQTVQATRTSVIARDDSGAPSVNFGVDEFSNNHTEVQRVTVRNLGSQRATFNVSTTKDSTSSPHSVNVSQQNVTVGPGQTAKVSVNLSVPAETVGDSSAFRDVAGFIKLTPTTTTSNAGIPLTVPYYLVPRARSQVQTFLQQDRARVVNASSSLAGTADFYAWGLTGVDQGQRGVDMRAVGVQSFDTNDGKMLVFAVNTFTPWSSAALYYFDIGIDINGDGYNEFSVFGIDLGLYASGFFNGQMVSGIYNWNTGETMARFLAVAPTDGNTILLPVLASDIGVTPASPRFSYDAFSRNWWAPEVSFIEERAKFNAFDNAISTGAFVNVGPHGQQTVPISINQLEWQQTPAKGVMVVSTDNFTAGPFAQTQLLPMPRHP